VAYAPVSAAARNPSVTRFGELDPLRINACNCPASSRPSSGPPTSSA
jgi:hypothetical protein